MLRRLITQRRSRRQQRAFARSPREVARRAAHAALVAERGWNVSWPSMVPVVYAEGDRRFAFDGLVTERQPLVYVPDVELWDRVTPEWLHGRRDEVVERIASSVVHSVTEVHGQYPPT